VGDDKELIKVKAGDVVLFDKYGGTEINIEGKNHLIMKMDDILATIQ
jgi:chaperonin GroES